MPIARKPAADYERERRDAERRIAARDPDDWPTVALALTLALPIWSQDRTRTSRSPASTSTPPANSSTPSATPATSNNRPPPQQRAALSPQRFGLRPQPRVDSASRVQHQRIGGRHRIPRHRRCEAARRSIRIVRIRRLRQRRRMPVNRVGTRCVCSCCSSRATRVARSPPGPLSHKYWRPWSGPVGKCSTPYPSRVPACLQPDPVGRLLDVGHHSIESRSDFVYLGPRPMDGRSWG
jgi:hypothetical protein